MNREDFEVLNELTYLDSAATSQKPPLSTALPPERRQPTVEPFSLLRLPHVTLKILHFQIAVPKAQLHLTADRYMCHQQRALQTQHSLTVLHLEQHQLMQELFMHHHHLQLVVFPTLTSQRAVL